MCISHAVLGLLVFLLFCFSGYKSSSPQQYFDVHQPPTFRIPRRRVASERVAPRAAFLRLFSGVRYCRTE